MRFKVLAVCTPQTGKEEKGDTSQTVTSSVRFDSLGLSLQDLEKCGDWIMCPKLGLFPHSSLPQQGIPERGGWVEIWMPGLPSTFDL